MRIAVIAHALRAGGGVSVGRNLLLSFSRIAREHSYLFVVPANVGYETLDLSAIDHHVVYFEKKAGYLGRWVFDQFKMPRLIQDFKPDIVLGLGNRGMTTPPCAQAVLCQNAHLFYPWKHFGKETWLNYAANAYKKWVFRQSLRRTELLLCQTPVAGARLKQAFGYSGRIALLPNAVSVDSLAGGGIPDKPMALENTHHSLKLFCLTRYYPHKNLEAVVDMFIRHREELRDVLVILTISANDHPNAKRLLHAIDKHHLTSNIANIGPLKQQELYSYYRHCQALFLPTLLESFSGTYLEAMQFGSPILTSNLDFAHQICGDAAMYFDPWNANSMKDAILDFQNRPELAARMAENGARRILGTYKTWDNIVLETCKEMEKIATVRQYNY